ncbi:hypothetical protein GGR52DRAFT_536075 [Hypoxylon sp. FL1284]|nr:hypothetical protein GGR52DRAFT_536075 [Hypoxylon sp. FL1284]
MAPGCLTPPFLQSQSLVQLAAVTHPPFVRTAVAKYIVPPQDLEAYLTHELDTRRLSFLHKYLWLAGLPVPARPLHRQRLMNRNILVTERADEHLVWHEHRIFIKPLPAFLLCHDFWEKHLCSDRDLHASACGMLLSYAWLVAYRSDFAIARDASLLPPDVTWERWTGFAAAVLQTLDLASMAGVAPRYEYGELRLSRLDMLTRWFWPVLLLLSEPGGTNSNSANGANGTGMAWSPRRLVDGYMSSSTWYTAFFERHFGWLLVGFVYVTVVLSALQVGLATEALAGSRHFQDFGLGVTLAGLAILFLALAAMLAVWLVLFWYHLLSTIAFDRRTRLRRRKARQKKSP